MECLRGKRLIIIIISSIGFISRKGEGGECACGYIACICKRAHACVYVRVCVRERQRKRESRMCMCVKHNV